MNNMEMQQIVCFELLNTLKPDNLKNILKLFLLDQVKELVYDNLSNAHWLAGKFYIDFWDEWIGKVSDKIIDEVISSYADLGKLRRLDLDNMIHRIHSEVLDYMRESIIEKIKGERNGKQRRKEY